MNPLSIENLIVSIKLTIFNGELEMVPLSRVSQTMATFFLLE